VGYYTAIVMHAVGAQGRGVGVEVDRELAAKAKQNLQHCPNVEVIAGDGSLGQFGSFDAIFVNAGCTQLQPAWLDQLAVGGRLLAPLTVDLPLPGLGAGAMLLVTKRQSGEYAARFTAPVGIYHCDGARTPEGNAHLARAFSQGGRENVVRVRRDEHTADPYCWLHASDFCLSRSQEISPSPGSRSPA
jgi:protein-L-isoaspartate(D-aspartate) O-methyltransferase